MSATSTASTKKTSRKRAVATVPEDPAVEVEGAVELPVDSGSRQEMIATAAYFLAERRGFSGGGDLDDWLTAEADIDRRLASDSLAISVFE